MKANEAPKNVYLAINVFGDIIKDQWQFHRLHDDDIEYTRTDAFIEKACVKLKKLMYDNLMFQGRLYRQEVIDNFVEDFKNRIKLE